MATLHWTTMSEFNTYRPPGPESLSTNCQDVGIVKPLNEVYQSQLTGRVGREKVRDGSERVCRADHLSMMPCILLTMH